MTPEEEIAALGRDLHYLGVVNSVAIPAKLYDMGWRKRPGPAIVPQSQIQITGVDTPTHWANGQPRLLTPKAYDRLSAERARRDRDHG